MYRIASITKTFTGSAIMQLRAAGLLQLDDPAVSFLPELRGGGGRFGAIESVTIRRLLSHESGLRSEPPGTDWSIPRFEGDVARTLAHAGEIGTVVPPNRQWKYSNLGYQLLGEIVARVSGSPYTDYVSEKILQPLGMSATSFEPLPGQLARGLRPATPDGPSPTSSRWRRRCLRSSPREVSGPASRTCRDGSACSSAPMATLPPRRM